MKSFVNGAFRCVAAYLALSIVTAAQGSEFLQLCAASMEKAESFLTECKKNARPFKRDFVLSGRGAPVPEEHSAWFDVQNGGSHFGLGCVLGPKSEVRFLGMYFFLKQSNFDLANSAPLSFIDFSGNVGLSPVDDHAFTLLAVHRLTPLDHERGFRDGNCQLGEFKPSSNETINRVGSGFRFYQVRTTKPLEIISCTSREVKYDSSHCSMRTYRSFLSNDNSAIIYTADLAPLVVITETARLFIESGLLKRFCEDGRFRHPLEYMNFVAELCGKYQR